MKRRLLLVGLFALLAAGCGSSPAPRPDLVFVSSRDGAYQLYGMSADGKHQRRLTRQKGDPSSPDGLYYQVEPAWSPNGRLIAFSSRRNGRWHIYAMHADGSGTRRLTNGLHDDHNPTWSPDGSRIAFDRDGTLVVMNADGTASRAVSREAADDSDPAWSPSGRWLAYVRRPAGTTAGELWFVHPNGSGDHRLIRLGTGIASPAWAPSGGRLAFSGERPDGTWEIYVIGADGKHLRELTVTGAGSFEPSWSPDGTDVAFWSDGSIFTVDLQGHAAQLTSGKNDSSPVWRPSPGQP